MSEDILVTKEFLIKVSELGNYCESSGFYDKGNFDLFYKELEKIVSQSIEYLERKHCKHNQND